MKYRFITCVLALIALIALLGSALAAQLTANRNTPRLGTEGYATQRALTVLAGEIIYQGGMVALKPTTGEVEMASDATGLVVIGIAVKYVDNTADGLTISPPVTGVFLLSNSVTNTVAATHKGALCYVEDDHTVGTTGTHKVVAGVVRDVTSDGVWVQIGTDATAPGSVTGSQAATVSDSSAAAGLLVVYSITVTGGAAGNSDVVIDQPIRVLDTWAVMTGGAGASGDTIRLYSLTNPISNAMSWSAAAGVSADAVVRAGVISTTYARVAAGGTLRVTTTDNDSGGDVTQGRVYVLGIPVQ